MAGAAFSEVRFDNDVEQDLAFTIVLRRLDDDSTLTFKVYPFHDIELLKRMLLRRLGAGLRISDLQIYYNGIELKNRRLLITFANMDDKIVTLHWKVRDSLGKHLVVRGLRPAGGIKLSSRHLEWINNLNACLQSRINPKLTSEGTGSTYILFNQLQRPIGIFKPMDEEAFAPCNPRGYVGRMGQRGFREGVVSGEGYAREVSAYLLDAYYGSMSNVPTTILVEAIHPHFCYDPTDPKATRQELDMVAQTNTGGGWQAIGLPLKRKKKSSTDRTGKEGGSAAAAPKESPSKIQWKSGSLQQFIDAKDTCGDYDPGVFSVADVHKIAILDLRLCNMDRNDGNILVLKQDAIALEPRLQDMLENTPFLSMYPEYKTHQLITPDGRQTKYRLVPIDHGLTLPDCFDITDFDLAWLNWPQAHIGFSAGELEYIQRLKPDKDAEWLVTKLDIRSECLRTMQLATRLLKKGAQCGLTLHQIAMHIVRVSPDVPSPIEKFTHLAVSQAYYACYAAHMVHKRAGAMATFVMDLAAPAQDKNTSHSSLHQLNEDILHRHTSLDDSLGASAHTVSSGGQQSRSKTAARSRAPHQNADYQKTTHRLRNFTNWRVREDRESTNNLWTIEDAGGRMIYPDWDDPVFQQRFFDAFDNILELQIHPHQSDR